MKTSLGYIASMLSATAIVVTLGLAPVAVAATDTTSGPHAIPLKAAPAVQTPSSSLSAPEPPPYGFGVDPLVLTDTGADPFVLMPQADGLAF